MRRLGGIGALAALLVSACAPLPPSLPAQPVAAGPGITIAAAAVPLNPKDLAQTAIGAFRYAGGLVLTSADTSRLHGLSDLQIAADGSLVALSDEGDLLHARLKLDAQGRLAGVTDARLTVLTGGDGKPLQGKVESDSEGLALLADGDLLVSFEEHHRILRYPADGSAPKPAPMPDATFPFNDGMEGLAPDPAAGPDAYIVGAESTGQTWSCKLSAACVAGPAIEKPGPEFGLTAMTRAPGGRTAYLMRAWDPMRGNRITLTVRDAAGAEVGRLDLAQPFTVDNLEGLAALPSPHGAIRFYLISDDNFSGSQRTLLLAFDWSPKP